jgi:hypothetical protein
LSDWHPPPANEDLSAMVVIGNPQHRWEILVVQLQDGSRHI